MASDNVTIEPVRKERKKACQTREATKEKKIIIEKWYFAYASWLCKSVQKTSYVTKRRTQKELLKLAKKLLLREWDISWKMIQNLKQRDNIYHTKRCMKRDGVTNEVVVFPEQVPCVWFEVVINCLRQKPTQIEPKPKLSLSLGIMRQSRKARKLLRMKGRLGVMKAKQKLAWPAMQAKLNTSYPNLKTYVSQLKCHLNEKKIFHETFPLSLEIWPSGIWIIQQLEVCSIDWSNVPPVVLDR